MCTIYTFTRALWERHYDDIVERIVADSVFNNDGASILTDNGTLMRSTEEGDGVNAVLDVLDGARWDRVWLHLRAATTGYIGIDGCHGFDTGQGTFVFHNGILRNKQAVKFPVDSQLIAAVVKRLGMERALKYLTTEPYANVFLVDTVAREYHVSRSVTGSLFTDGFGNYSSNMIEGVLDQPVPERSLETYVIERPAPVGRRIMKYG